MTRPSARSSGYNSLKNTHMTKHEFELRRTVLLTFLFAFVGNVFPTLRRVSVSWTETTLAATFYVDGEMNDGYRKCFNAIEDSILASLAGMMTVRLQVLRLDYPEPIDDPRESLFARWEGECEPDWEAIRTLEN